MATDRITLSTSCGCVPDGRVVGCSVFALLVKPDDGPVVCGGAVGDSDGPRVFGTFAEGVMVGL